MSEEIRDINPNRPLSTEQKVALSIRIREVYAQAKLEGEMLGKLANPMVNVENAVKNYRAASDDAYRSLTDLFTLINNLWDTAR